MFYTQYNLPRDFPHSECRGYLTVYSTSSRIVQRMLDWGRHREWSFAPFTVLDVGNPSYWNALLPVFVNSISPIQQNSLINGYDENNGYDEER